MLGLLVQRLSRRPKRFFTVGSSGGVSYKDTPVRAILIAAKHLAFAKTRLGRAVGDADRIALAEAMFRDVLAAALSARAAEHGRR